ncbi:hypothetical protein BD414DRAFT_220832 [Trametes punicea]|nr:hypothetical protein BD414DRAFT_220832 [Trametes punicea]
MHASSLSGRRGGMTPHGPGVASVAGLTYKIEEAVRLKYTVNDQFEAGDIVEICSYEQAPPYLTKREGQSTERSMTDSDTLHRLFKHAIVYHDSFVNSASQGDLVVPHSAYSLTRNGRCALDAHRNETLVYTIREVQILKGHREYYSVPPGVLQG